MSSFITNFLSTVLGVFKGWGGMPGFWTSSSLELLIVAGRAVFLVAAFTVMAVAFTRWRRMAQRDTQRVFEQLDIALSELRSLAEQTLAIAARMDTFEGRLDSALRIAPAVSSAPQRGYETAVRIARTGASIEQIINTCGMTRHEAELLVRLHAPASSTQAPVPQVVSAETPAALGEAQVAEPPPAPTTISVTGPIELIGSPQEERRKARSRLSVVVS